MDSVTDLLRGELERLFELDDMVRISSELLGFEPGELGSAGTKGSFARSLVDRCASEDALQALGDAILLSSRKADRQLLTDLMASAPDGELAPGTRVGSLRVVKKIGAGGLGVVYLAEGQGDEDTEARRVALKVIRPEYARDRSGVRRFQTASRVMQAMQIPHLAPVIGVGQLDDARPWVAAEYLTGQSLAARIRSTGYLHFNEATPIFRDVIAALEALHERGLVHGNLKTENVFLVRASREDGSGFEMHAVLADGCVNRLRTPTKATAGTSGLLSVLGTAKAIAPEQARGVDSDLRSDIYAMGVMMYEVVAGRPPFQGDDAMDIVALHLSAAPEPPSVHAKRGWVSSEVDAFILRALAKEPGDRYQTAGELREALKRIGQLEKKRAPLDRIAFDAARAQLLQEPGNDEAASSLEQLARDAGAWEEALDTFEQACQAADDGITQVSLLFRIARICESDMEDTLRAENTYRGVLELDPENQVALSALETCKRARGDAQGLVELLLDRMERETTRQGRATVLREIATLYEDELRDMDNAFLAWMQALSLEPREDRAAAEIRRLAALSPQRWTEAVEAVSVSAQELYAELFPDEASEEAVLEERGQQLEAQLQQAQETAEATDLAVQVAQQNVSDAEEQLAEATRQAEAVQDLAEERAEYSHQAQRAADDTVARYEEALAAAQAPGSSPEAQGLAAQLGEEAERLVEAADLAEQQLQEYVEQVSVAEQTVQELDAGAEEMRQQLAAAEQEADGARAGVQDILAAIDEQRDPESRRGLVVEERDRKLADLVQLYVLMGRWYAEWLSRPDLALSCFSEALALDPANEGAFDGAIDLYRMSQSWEELAGVLKQRADRTINPHRARDYRVEHATIVAEKLGDQDAALEEYQAVLAEDPGHPSAQKAVEKILVERENWPELAALLEKRLEATQGPPRLPLLNTIGELYEDRVDDLDAAAGKYEQALEIEPLDMTALKGLERIYARRGNYDRLLQNLQAQVEVAPTPKQRITLLERIAAIREEEFLDYPGAAEELEMIVEIDPGHNGANTGLARLYRQMESFERVVETLQRHARATDDEAQMVGLLLQSVRVLMTELKAPDRAMVTCERVLELDPEQAEALELIAHLKSKVGDSAAALEAVERLAEAEQNPRKRGELYTRAGKLLEDTGDKEGALIRYRKALDADKNATEATDALRRIYAQRGDYHATVEMLQHEITTVEGELKKAELFAELGHIYCTHLGDLQAAQEAFEQALQLDPTCTDAAVKLGELFFEQGDYKAATQYFESVYARLNDMDHSKASEVCIAAGEAFKRLGDSQRARDAFKRARDFAPDDLEVNERLGALEMELGDAHEAERLYSRIYQKFGEQMPDEAKGRVLLALGEAQLKVKRPEQAIESFRAACQLRPNDPAALDGLTRAHEAAGEWSEVVSLLQLRSRKAPDREEAFRLAVQTGDVFLEKLGDRKAAAQTYVAALELEPQNRNLLTKLMAVYSGTQDWPRLIEVILRIAEMVDDAAQLAKYYNTAGTIAHLELSRYGDAANYYEQALEYEPTLDAAFAGLVECLAQNQDWERLDSAYHAQMVRLGESVPPEHVVQFLDARGEILLHRLGRLAEAAEVYRMAQELDPTNRTRREVLADIYARDPKQFFAENLATQRELLDADPYRVDSYRSMRKTYTKLKRPDESWCVCQVLYYLNVAAPDEDKFFRKYRLAQLVKIKNPLTSEMWRTLVMHPAQGHELTAIFATLRPAVIAAQAQPLAAFGIDPRQKVDPASHPTAMGRMLYHTAAALQLELPDVYNCPNHAGGLSFVFSDPPGIAIGQGARAGGPQQALAFLAARHMSYFAPGHFIRQLVPTGTGLRAWMMAAIRMVTPKFPVPPTLDAQVKECRGAIDKHLTGPQRDAVRSLTQKLLEAAPELDMKRWVSGVDLAADRIGFALCNDLKVAAAVIGASPVESSVVGAKDRVRELLRYAVSEEYFELRRHLGIALGS